MKKFLAFLGVVIVALFAVMSVNAGRLAPPPTANSAAAVTVPSFDTGAAAAHLAGAVKFSTVSFTSGGPVDTAQFLGIHTYFDQTFPLVHEHLKREVINGLSLLYTWQGSDATLPPLVLMGHFDVVPVPEPNLKDWQHGPFSGDVADGYVWGRGTLDDKSTVLAVLEAVESLLRSGYAPKRTVYLTFGHDEEVGGRYGARFIVDTLVARGVKPALVLDEGGFMGSGILPGVTGRAAIVGVAEKGYLSLKLTAKAEGGHSSMPPARTAVGALSRAIAALEANPFPGSLNPPSRLMMESMAPYMPFSRKLLMANLWLTAPVIEKGLSANPLGAALLHTTTAPTMLSAGIKDNVLAPEASAIVNFRIAPGETVNSVIERVHRVIADSLITVSKIDSAGVDPSPVSDAKGPEFGALASTIQSMDPGATVPVIPYLVFGGTDAKYWGAHSAHVYRFLPIPLGDGDRDRVHGLNERVKASDYGTAVGFIERLIERMDK
ncbi:MAG: M20 family peptidase [Gemmatimonadaceae bacterium]